MPVLPDNSGALLRRVIMVETPNSYAGREDFDLLDTLVAELPGFINVALDAYSRLKALAGGSCSRRPEANCSNC